MYSRQTSSRGGYQSRGGGGFRGSKPGGRFNNRRSSFKPDTIDESKYINKAVITEEVDVFVPEHSFPDFAIHNKLKTNLAGLGFTSPTPIQDRAIPHILRGDDVVGIANTGTGKTLAFIIPLLDKVINNPKEKILIIAPTRELAQQIDDELRKFNSGTGIYSVVGVGGLPIYKQVSALRRQYNFFIGTPGRLMDIKRRKAVDFSQFNTVVLDEADRMLDMGFIKDIEEILSDMSKERQTLFFSATMSREIEALIHRYLREHVTISVKTADTSKNVDQDILRIKDGQSKIDALIELLNKEEFDKVLVFGRTKRGVENLSRDLVKKGFKSESIHGDKTQSRREKALSLFKKNGIQILVATDVAARGLDIPNVSHVINYDVPDNYNDYVHRIGRTGRGGKMGKALTFIEKGQKPSQRRGR